MTALDLTTLSRSLKRDPSGIWTAGSTEAADSISFPEAGHGECFELEDDSFWFGHRNECISLGLRRFPFEGPFLDVGGGNGAVSKHLARGGVETILLEPGPAGAKNAHDRGLENVICATLEQAAFAPASVGAAGMFDVIEHVEDDSALLSAAHAVLRRRGVLCVTVPAYAWLWSAEDEYAGHFRRYTARGLRRVLERNGFEVQYLTYFFAPLTLPLFLMRSLRYRFSKGAPVDPKAAAEQHMPRPALRRAMELCLSPETRAIARGGKIPFGTSCLAIALAK